MTDKSAANGRGFFEKLTSTLLALPWSEVLIELWQLLRKAIRDNPARGPYEVLEYESTLELLDPEGRRAIFRKREKVRYLQDNIIAYQDQAWGDGEILVNYRCTPGKPVDRYRLGHKWHTLISRQEVKNRGDIDVFSVEWEIRQGFLKPTGYWETHVTHQTEHLKIDVIFPVPRHPRHMTIAECNRRRTHTCGIGTETLLPDGRCLVRWETHHPRLHENYAFQWVW